MKIKNNSLLETICTMSQEKLFQVLIKYLESNYNRLFIDEEYIVAAGQSPVTLIAHIDTINEGYYNKEAEFCIYDSKKDMFHALGGCTLDDRLGVYAIIKIIDAGYKPSVIFTTGEELGGIGALSLTEHFPTCPYSTNFLIELDRQGKNDAVYYSCGNNGFKKFINSSFVYPDTLF